MIELLKKKFWKVDGMDFIDNPIVKDGVFHLEYEKQLIGILTYSKNQWIFEYSDHFRANPFLEPIMDFPVLDKKS